MIDVEIDGRRLQMELDAGATCGIIGESKLRRIKPKFSLLPSDRQFSSYSGHRIHCLGRRLPVHVSVGSTTRRLNLYVVSEESDSLFGRDWIAHFTDQINLNQIFTQGTSINSLMSTELTPAIPLVLATDVSKTGLGAVLSHRMSNGMERPIAYASCTMSVTEQRYPHIDKGALAIVWAVKKFFYYLYARKFTLITDHMPLTQILHSGKSLPTLCISPMANYADYLAHFNFDVVYKPTSQNTNADYCSRIPSRSTQSGVNSLSLHEGRDTEDEFAQFTLHQIEQLSVRAEHIARETRKDTHLGKIVQYLKLGRNLPQSCYKAPEAK